MSWSDDERVLEIAKLVTEIVPGSVIETTTDAGVCNRVTCDFSPDDLEAVRAVAAAPELLGALEMMLDKFQYDVEPGEAGSDAVEAARKAVAKAKGVN